MDAEEHIAGIDEVEAEVGGAVGGDGAVIMDHRVTELFGVVVVAFVAVGFIEVEHGAEHHSVAIAPFGGLDEVELPGFGAACHLRLGHTHGPGSFVAHFRLGLLCLGGQAECEHPGDCKRFQVFHNIKYVRMVANLEIAWHLYENLPLINQKNEHSHTVIR